MLAPQRSDNKHAFQHGTEEDDPMAPTVTINSNELSETNGTMSATLNLKEVGLHTAVKPLLSHSTTGEFNAVAVAGELSFRVTRGLNKVLTVNSTGGVSSPD
eukprot:1030114-Prorocentrum_minimum.AAC.1